MIVIIIGMHRSGTSALAGLLHTNGIVMGQKEKGDFFPPPQKENPLGFFENKRFRMVNDLLLRGANYRVKSFSPATPDWEKIAIPSELWNRSVELLNYYDSRYKIWGFKDPRTCLTLHFWLASIKMFKADFRSIRPIVIVRDAISVSDSMCARGNKETLYKGQFAALCRVYYGEALRSLASAQIPYLQLTFNHLIYNKKSAAETIGDYLEHSITNLDFVDHKISRQGTK